MSAPDGPETGAQVRATAAESARQLRGVLAELAEPGSEITAHPGTRTRLEGAAMALEALAVDPGAGRQDVVRGPEQR